MRATIKLSDSEYQEIINVDEIIDPNILNYKDQDNALNTLSVLSNGIKIIRKANDHDTKVVLFNNEESYISVDTQEGNLRFDVKVLEFVRKDDIITLVYRLDNEDKKIEIKYIGV